MDGSRPRRAGLGSVPTGQAGAVRRMWARRDRRPDRVLRGLPPRAAQRAAPRLGHPRARRAGLRGLRARDRRRCASQVDTHRDARVVLGDGQRATASGSSETARAASAGTPTPTPTATPRSPAPSAPTSSSPEPDILVGIADDLDRARREAAIWLDRAEALQELLSVADAAADMANSTTCSAAQLSRSMRTERERAALRALSARAYDTTNEENR